MKLFLSITFLLSSAIAHSQSGNSEHLVDKGLTRMSLESGRITYHIGGDATGTATLTFDRDGWRQILEKEFTFEKYGITSTIKTTELVDGDYTFTINYDNQKGQKTKDSRWSDLLSYKSLEESVEAMMEDAGGMPQGDTTLLNRPSNIYLFQNGSIKSIWEWQGIPLKELKSLGGLNIIMTATQFEEMEISEESFALPPGITWDD